MQFEKLTFEREIASKGEMKRKEMKEEGEEKEGGGLYMGLVYLYTLVIPD